MTVEMSLIDRVLRVIVLATVVSNVLTSGDQDIPVLVSRRLSGDSYWHSNDDFQICRDNLNLTYLVSEDRCAKDQELFNGNIVGNNSNLKYYFFCHLDCGFATVPNGEPSNLSIALVLNGSNLRIADPEASLTDATIVSITNGTHQLVNGSVCQISSLEVYRGRSQITVISYDGLSLSGSGTVKVNLLYYSILPQVQMFIGFIG